MRHMSSLRAGSEPDRPGKSVLRAILILLWSTCVSGINIFKNFIVTLTRAIPQTIQFVCLFACSFILQVLVKATNSRKWSLFEYNGWTKPNVWFTIKGTAPYKKSE